MITPEIADVRFALKVGLVVGVLVGVLIGYCIRKTRKPPERIGHPAFFMDRKVR